MAFPNFQSAAAWCRFPNYPITRSPNPSSAVPMQIPPIPVHIPILTRQLSPLMPRCFIISTIQIAPQVSPIMSDPHFIVPNVAPVAPCVVSKHRSLTHSQQQQYPSNCPFHIDVPPPLPADSTEYKHRAPGGVALTCPRCRCLGCSGLQARQRSPCNTQQKRPARSQPRS